MLSQSALKTAENFSADSANWLTPVHVRCHAYNGLWGCPWHYGAHYPTHQPAGQPECMRTWDSERVTSQTASINYIAIVQCARLECKKDHIVFFFGLVVGLDVQAAIKCLAQNMPIAFTSTTATHTDSLT